MILFVIVWLGLLGLVSWWWNSRYQAQAELLEERVTAWVANAERIAIKRQLGKLDSLLGIRINKDGSVDTVHTQVKWQSPETFSFEGQSPSFKVDVNEAQEGQRDTLITVRLDFQKIVSDGNFVEGGLDSLSQALGVQLALLSDEASPITVEDTLGQWFVPLTDFRSLETFGDEVGLSKRITHPLLLISHYRPTLLRRIIPEILLGLSLLVGLLVFFLLVRRDLLRQNRLLEQKDRLIANIAHELKTPIATVGVALEALENFGADADPQRRKEYLQIGRQELDRLGLLADRALKTLQLDSGALEVNREPVNLLELVQRAWSSLALPYQLTAANFELNTSEAPTTVNGDPELLQHLVYNLLDNACKYGGDPLRVSVDLSRQNGSINLSVADNGVGIPATERERVFEKFYRIDRGGGHQVKGHGLGLTYVRQIAEAHGGTVKVSTGKDKSGALFTVTIPHHER